MNVTNSLTFLADKKSKDFRNYIDILIMKKIHLVCSVLFISAVSLFGVTEGRIPSSREMNNTRTEIRRLYTNGNYQSVVTLCKKIVNTYPEDRFAPLYLAYSYERLGQYHPAESIYLRCLQSGAYSEEDVSRIKGNLANVYTNLYYRYVNRRQINQAFNVVKSAQYYLPEHDKFYMYDAELNIMMENYSEAIQQIKKSWEIDSSTVEDKLDRSVYKLHRMGDCYRKLGKPSYNEWKKYITPIYKKNPDNDAITLILADIYFLNDEERSKRNNMRNKVMQRYLNKSGERAAVAVQLPVRGRWYVSSGAFQSQLDTHNGYDGYCVDLVMINEDGKSRIGNGTTNDECLTFGQQIYAAADGVVERICINGQDNAPGCMDSATLNFVTLRHESNGQVFYTKYLHLKQFSSPLKVGQSVKAGDLIGQCGNSGYSTGSHLHFGIYDENNVSLPVTFLVGEQEIIPKFKMTINM
ncbi:MAG: peptidoglycan DD-metalloendopeptidase family protein [Spirochaetales bacterium]|nr:peptidoglycan DD-metalloendopeptidase family protein [Spirochaetales bacterium]